MHTGVIPGLMPPEFNILATNSSMFGPPENEMAEPGTPSREPLPADKVEKALKWAENENIGSECVRQLQRKLEITETGVYDEATVQAVYNYQAALKEDGHVLSVNGKATGNVMRRLGIVFTEEFKAAGSLPDFFKEIMDDQGNPKPEFANGISVGCYTHYDDFDDKSKSRTFKQRADKWAKYNKAVGLDDSGNLKVGASVKTETVGDIVESVQAIAMAMAAIWEAHGNKVGGPDGQAMTSAPDWCRLKNLALFAHGMPYGIGVNHDNDKQYRHGLLSDAPYRNTEANLESFVEGVRSGLRSDVNVQLFACNAARDYDPDDYMKKPENANRQMPEGQEMGSDDSLAYKLAAELGGDASVYGHLTEGHTTNNFASLAYGKAADGATSKHIFDILYPDTFIDAELQRLFPGEGAEFHAAVRPLLREEMFAHYKDSINYEYHRQAGKKEITNWKGDKVQIGDRRYGKDETDLGADMFTNPEACGARMQKNFQDFWLTDKAIDAMRKQVVPKK